MVVSEGCYFLTSLCCFLFFVLCAGLLVGVTSAFLLIPVVFRPVSEWMMIFFSNIVYK